ncbi:MMPL family transporter [Thermodesulfobacteriota bacterium]
MFDKYFSSAFDHISKNRNKFHVLLIVLIGLSFWGLSRIHFENNIEKMLPANQEVQRSIRFLRESNISDKVMLSISLKQPAPDISLLIEATDELADSLKGDLVTDIITGMPEGDVIQQVINFMGYIPQLTDKSRLESIGSGITHENVDHKLAQIFTQLLSPGGGFMMPFFRSDPLGISDEVFKSLRDLTSSLGYRVNIEQGHLISEDGGHTLLILETPVLLTDGLGAGKLLAHIHKHVQHSSHDIVVKIIAGHCHTVSNEKIVKKDIMIVCLVASTAFLLMFLLVFRDPRAILILLMPFLSVLLSINLSAIILGTLSYFVIGFGAVIVGIAIDYGIHVYVAKKTAGPRSIITIARPVITGALTTLSVFFSFFFSTVSGYTQLACFSIISILICLLLSMFLLPHLVGEESRPDRKGILRKTEAGIPAQHKWIVAAWIVFILALLLSMCRLDFNTDIRQFDGSEQHVFDDEAEFHRIWGNETEPAILVVGAPTLEEALQKNDSIAQEAFRILGRDNFSSIASIWNSRQIRVRNLQRWNDFWKGGAERDLRQYINASLDKYRFSSDAFDPFFNDLYASRLTDGMPDELPFFENLQERFVMINDNRCQIMSYFDDTEENMRLLRPLVERDQSIYLVSRKNLSKSISDSVLSEIVKLSFIAGGLILFLLFLLLRDIRLSLLSLIPVLTAIITILGILPLLGMGLTAISIIAAMVVVGLCIDYGIFIVYHYHRNMDTGTDRAVTLSAVTTVIGAGALLFAQHPVMFIIGVTLVSGITAGYASAMLVVPEMYRMTLPHERK